jgi:hypothetical protein
MLIKSVTCKNCDAPLALLGNVLRSRNLICQYCGTVMDVRDDFKALYSFKQIQAHNPLSIGDIIPVKGINFTVTGFIHYANSQNQWHQYQLYCPSHGYAKLINRNNQFIFYRKTHKLPDKNLWMLKQGDSFKSNGIEFSIRAFEYTEIYYAAGNLIDAIKQGKRLKHCFASCTNTDIWFYSMHKRYAIEHYQGYEIFL